MSPDLPFDIIALIIDIVGENNDTDLLKELALVSHSFLQICSRHLFATVDLRDADPDRHVASSKKGFIKLLQSRPDVVKYIRKLMYTASHHQNECHLNLPILPSLLRTISRLNCLTIVGSMSEWNRLDSSLTSAFLHLMHLPTINHIDLSYILNFPLSSLPPSVSLRLDMLYLNYRYGLKEVDIPDVVVQSMPKIREFRTSSSALPTTKLMHAKKQDGQPAFNFVDLRRLSICLSDKRNLQYLLQNAKLLEQLHLSVGVGQNLVGLHDILFPSERTLKVLDLTLPLNSPLPLAGLCEELEAMAGHNMLEVLSIEARLNNGDTEDLIGSTIQEVEKVLIKPGWSALRQVSFKVLIPSWGNSSEMFEALQSLPIVPDKYIRHISKLESVAFNYSAAYVQVGY